MKLRSALSAALLIVGLQACATAPAPEAPALPPSEAIERQVEGVRLGLMVATLAGEVIEAERAQERFIPASNTKIFTAAAAFRFIPSLTEPDLSLGTSLLLLPGEAEAPPSLVLRGAGDPKLSDRPDCLTNCLSMLADAVAARGIVRVDNIIGDASLFPFEPYGLGWSWNNLPFYYGAPVSALTVNGNSLALRVSPGAAEGAAVLAEWAAGDDLMPVVIEAVTGAAGSENGLSLLRWPGTEAVRISGSLPLGTAPRSYFLSVNEPAEMAAQRLKRLLEARGVIVEGGVVIRTRRDWALLHEGLKEIARLEVPPLIEAVNDVSRDSDNLAAELLLRHIARATGGDGSEDGLEAINQMLEEAGIGRVEVELFDGSGLTPYNRITPAATVKFLTWAAAQPWGDTFRETLPIGGETGSLARRFRGTALQGRIFAKTGTVQGVNALSGYMIAASGETLVFSVIANDRPADAPSVLALIDRMLIDIAAAN
ncbi:D-alanyl-D-alanine carboxypeptidase/D-alanyl-D-alanine-endopeptidase [Hyphomonas sp.]|uniref:D-alanyl-D-alanine carboxypeptidase/D-alanyl-D-alanine endopeptidase n=1 Tax=Hyphomonas sp. TaxID=87 RepID=UPI00391C00B0